MTWLLSLTLFLLPSYLIRFSFLGIPSTVLEVLIYLNVLVLLISQPLALTGERLKVILRQYGWPITLILIGAVIGSLISPDKRVALGLFKGYIVDPILLFLVIITTIDTPLKQQRGLFGLLAGAGIMAATAIIGPYNVERRSLGLYALDLNPSPNFVALYLAPLFALVGGMVAKPASVKMKSVLTALGVLLGGAIFWSGSRGGILAGLFILGFTAIDYCRRLSVKSKKYWSFLGYGFIVLSIIAGYCFARPNFSPTADRRASTSNNLRYEIWRTTVVDIIPRHPITGLGLGNYQSYFTTITKDRVNFPEFIAPWARTPHNIFLNLWVNLGLFGLVGFIWLLVIFYRQISRQADASSLSYGLGLAMLALLIHGMVDAAYWKNDLAALFWVLLAFSWLVAQNSGKADHEAA